MLNSALGPLRPQTPNNIFGDRGPRCPMCSGLGKVLALGPIKARSTSRCNCCRGSGLDLVQVHETEMASVFRRLAALERQQMELLTARDRIPPRIKNSRQAWEELIAWATADGTAVANTTTETIAVPNVTIPANYMQDGRVLRMRVAGKLSTTATPTMTWALRWGGVAGTILATTEAITMGSGVANVNWKADLEVVTRSNGATGTLLVFGDLMVHTAAGTVLSNVWGVSGFDAPAVVTVDLTADQPLSFTADWSAASASNTLTGMIYSLESQN